MGINEIQQTVNFSLYCIYSGWTINGKNNAETNFVVGIIMATLYVVQRCTSPKKEIYIDRRSKAKLIQH